MATYRKKPDSYLNYKVSVLDDFGLHNKARVRADLKMAVRTNTTKTSEEYIIDRAARKMLEDYFEGDRFYAFKEDAVRTKPDVCPNCGRELYTIVGHTDRGRHYGIDRCNSCKENFEWEYEGQELNYFRRYHH